MAGTIKGITIELDGNTSKFQKSLSDANKSIKQTQTALKDVNKALKLDPKSTELLKQKQDLLKKSVEDVKKKLDIEKKGLEELAKQDQTPEVTKKMAELERQIAIDEAALKDATKELKEFGSVGKQQAKATAKEFQKTGKKIQEVGGKIKGVGESLTKNVTAPIMAVGGASLAAFNEVDAGYDTVIKKTGAAGEAAKEMYGIVDKLATSIPTDFQTAGEAVGEVNTRFGLTGDALQDLSEKFIKFAELNDTDVTTSVDAVQKAMAAFNVPAEEAGDYLDQLNKAAQDSGIGIGTLTSLTINNATALDEMGLSLGESTALMAQLEKSGVPVNTVMGGLSKALKKATDEGVPLGEALGNLQKTIAESDDDTEGLAAAYDLFGKSGAAVFKAVKDGSLNFEELGRTASESAGSVSDTFNETLDPIDQWQMTLNELKLTAAGLGSTIGEVLQPALEQVGEVVASLREKWSALSPEQQNMIVQIAGIVAVVGPVVAIIGSIVQGIGGLVFSIGTVSAALGVAASTVGIVIGAITAIIAAIALLILNWDNVKEAVRGAWQKVTEYTGQLKENVTKKFDEMKANVKQKIDTIKSDMSSKWNQIKSDAVTKVTGMKTDITTKLSDLKGKVTEKMNDIKAKFKEKLDDIKEFFSGLKLKIPKPELPSLPHFHLETSTKTIMGKEITYPTGFGVSWNAKAMQTPYLFTKPTVMATPYGMIGAGEAGNEVMYGQQALMKDITAAAAANNDTLVGGMYAAVKEALKSADLKVVVGNREVGRILREAGVK